MAEDKESKTEDPTQKRRQDARNKGQVARSQELNSVLVLILGSAMTYFWSPAIYYHYRDMIQVCWGHGFTQALAMLNGGTLFGRMSEHLFFMFLPVAFLVMVAGVVANLIQLGGFMLTMEPLSPKLDKLNVIKGIKQKFFSGRTYMELFKSIVKLLIVTYAVHGAIRAGFPLILTMSGAEPAEIIRIMGHLIVMVLLRVFAIMVLLVIIDVVYQRWSHTQQLKMTKQEVKDEHKQSEGDPKVKGRIRSMQANLARQRMMNQVPDATAVITNPTHFAVALKYEQGMEAPTVVAKGADHLAKRIIKIARDNRVPVIQNPPLARALYNQVKLDATIPVELYRAVAKILAYIYQQRGKR